jgi:hypothetical protein
MMNPMNNLAAQLGQVGLRASRMFPKTDNAVVIRTDFDNQEVWHAICNLIRAPVHEGDNTFYAYVDLVEDVRYRDLPVTELLAALPSDYKHSFLFVVDRDAISRPDSPVLVVDLHGSRGRTFRTVPTQVQSIENNLSIANMGFEEFAEAVGRDGVFRGFRA